MATGTRPINMSRGAYYRQVLQCRDKTIAALYSLLILELLGAVEPHAAEVLAKAAEQLRVIFTSENRDVIAETRSADVMSVIDQVIKRMCKL